MAAVAVKAVVRITTADFTTAVVAVAEAAAVDYLVAAVVAATGA